MTKPTASVFDNQSTSSISLRDLIPAGEIVVALVTFVTVVAFMYFGEMDLLTAIFCSAIAFVILAVIAVFFSFCIAPVLVLVMYAIAAVGFLLLGIAHAVYELFKALTVKDK